MPSFTLRGGVVCEKLSVETRSVARHITHSHNSVCKDSDRLLDLTTLIAHTSVDRERDSASETCVTEGSNAHATESHPWLLYAGAASRALRAAGATAVTQGGRPEADT